MNDILEEAKLELRNQQTLDFIKKYGKTIALIAIVSICTAVGFSMYKDSKIKKQAEAGDKFFSVVKENSVPLEKFDELIASSPSGYKELAEFRKAAQLIKENKTKEAEDVYKTIATRPGLSLIMKDLAELQIIYIALESREADLNSIYDNLKNLSSADRPFAGFARELQGVVLLKKGEKENAGKVFKELANDINTPPAMRQRVQILAESLLPGAFAEKEGQKESEDKQKK